MYGNSFEKDRNLGHSTYKPGVAWDSSVKYGIKWSANRGLPAACIPWPQLWMNVALANKLDIISIYWTKIIKINVNNIKSESFSKRVLMQNLKMLFFPLRIKPMSCILFLESGTWRAWHIAVSSTSQKGALYQPTLIWVVFGPTDKPPIMLFKLEIMSGREASGNVSIKY